MGARGAVGVDNSLGQQILDGIMALWHIGREEVIKSTVFTDEDDDMLDRTVGMYSFLSLERPGERSTQTELKHGHGDESNAQTMDRLCNDLLQGHAFSFSRQLRRGLQQAEREWSVRVTEGLLHR
jgi:hypothetical protein